MSSYECYFQVRTFQIAIVLAVDPPIKKIVFMTSRKLGSAPCWRPPGQENEHSHQALIKCSCLLPAQASSETR